MLVAALVLGATPARAQPEAAARTVTPASGMDAFRAVDGWVRQLEVVSDAAKNPALPRVRAASVSLRLAGVLLSRGQGFADDADTTSALSLAAASAISAAKSRLTETNAGSGAEVAPRLTISLELADALVPLNIATYAAADTSVRVGVEGVAARKGDQIAALFPEEMMLNADAPSDALARLAARLADDPTLAIKIDPRTQPPQITKSHGISFYRFRVTHLAQPSAERPPTFLQRLSVEVPSGDITAPGLRSLGDRLAAWLRREPLARDTSPGLFFVGQSRDAEPAALPSRALAAYAVARWASTATETDALAAAAKWSAQAMKADPPRDPFAAAALSLALCETAASSNDLVGVRERVALLVPRMLDTFDADARAFRAGTPLAQRGVIAMALARVSTAFPDVVNNSRVEPLVRSIYRDTPAAELVTHMPWLGWAELELARGKQGVPSTQALRAMRDAVREHTLRAEDLDETDVPLAGGIVFTSGVAGAAALPTAQSLRAAAFIATMVADPRLTSADERPLALALSLSHARFAAQLTWDGPSLVFSRDADRDRGGVRLSPWDARLSLDATTMALLNTTETIGSIGRLSEPKPQTSHSK